MSRYAIFIALLCLLLSTPVFAGTLIYDNGPDPGPAAAGNNAWLINFGGWVSDTFTANGTQIGSVQFSLWYTDDGATPASVQWAVSTASDNSGTSESAGFQTASGSNFSLGTATCNAVLDVCQAEVTIQLVPLIPASLNGTYWLTLENVAFTGTNSASADAYWGESDSGTSSAIDNNGNLTSGAGAPLTSGCPVSFAFYEGVSTCTSESFQVYESGGGSGSSPPPPAAPEPGTFVLLGSGLLLTAGALRRKARA